MSRHFTNQCGQRFVDIGMGFVPAGGVGLVSSALLQSTAQQVAQISEVSDAGSSCPPEYTAYRPGQARPGQSAPSPGTRYVGGGWKKLNDGTMCIKFGKPEQIPQSEMCATLTVGSHGWGPLYKSQMELIRSKSQSDGRDRAISWLVGQFDQSLEGNNGPVLVGYYLLIVEKGQNALTRRTTAPGWFLNASDQDKKRLAAFLVDCVSTTVNISPSSLPAGF